MRGLAVDPIRKTYWIYTSLSMFEVLIGNSDRDIWRIYLGQGKFDAALRHSKVIFPTYFSWYWSPLIWFPKSDCSPKGSHLNSPSWCILQRQKIHTIRTVLCTMFCKFRRSCPQVCWCRRTRCFTILSCCSFRENTQNRKFVSGLYSEI